MNNEVKRIPRIYRCLFIGIPQTNISVLRDYIAQMVFLEHNRNMMEPNNVGLNRVIFHYPPCIVINRIKFPENLRRVIMDAYAFFDGFSKDFYFRLGLPIRYHLGLSLGYSLDIAHKAYETLKERVMNNNFYGITE